jgi:hypothetical protein
MFGHQVSLLMYEESETFCLELMAVLVRSLRCFQVSSSTTSLPAM